MDSKVDYVDNQILPSGQNHVQMIIRTINS